MAKYMNITVDASISCNSADTKETWTQLYRNSDKHCSFLCSSYDLFDPEKNFFVYNELVITVCATLTINQTNPVASKMAKHDNIGWKLWKNDDDKDAVIVVNGRELKVHKCILKRCSLKFESLFKAESSGSTSTEKISINSHTFETVKEGIMFCYDIQITDKLSAQNATFLLKFAKEFQILDLQKNIEEFCIENLSSANASLFANSSIAAKNDKLYKVCFEYLLKCMKKGKAVMDIEKLDETMQRELFFKSFFVTSKETTF
uniref:BTB domain-containing protein n=1 Tax=Panagrolaimus sp. ES5 TaxID=591445 RepID=A0AC34G8X1_9BILA